LCPAGTTIGVAEHTILLILAAYKRLVVADTKMRQGMWLQWGLRSTSFELCGKTLGLVGFGRIGQAVAKRAHAFDAKILYHDAFIPVPPAEAKAWGVESVNLDDLLRRSDIVSIHVPTTDETRKFMNAERFAQMKRSAVFINTSRGAVVNEPDLVKALQDRVIAAAGLDVFEKEPINADNPLLRMDNVVLTPHISAGTVDALTEKMQAVFANMQRCVRGEPIHDRVV
jgi:phosphoglycerate dehydrogenase-like enzyme